jgi:arylsulfatase A-like enzyme
MKRREFLVTAGAALSPLAGQTGQRPNIVVILADDLGWGDLGVQGGTEIPTPNIDSIAKQGVRFTNGYVSCPVCSPTRAGLMTGRYQQRFGHEFNPGPVQQAEANFGLPLSETTLPQRLKAAGYATGLVGKWHLGYKPEYHPLRRGFDEYFGFLGGAHSYVDARADALNPILRGADPVDEKEYLTDAFAREAVSFIQRHQGRPFFLYAAFNAVHNPLQAPEKYTSRFAHIADPRRRTYAGMLSALDDAVGRILTALREAGLERNTLVFFLSDNGGPTLVTTSKNGPLREYKGTVYEGGIRVPFFLKWPAHIPAAKVYDHPVIALDIHPTCTAAAGLTDKPPKPLDGVDLVPFLTGKRTGAPHDALYWRFGERRAIRQGDWKLVMNGESTELFNLRNDIGEQNNLAAAQPARVKELQASYQAWNAQLMEPLWARGGAGRRGQRRRNP